MGRLLGDELTSAGHASLARLVETSHHRPVLRRPAASLLLVVVTGCTLAGLDGLSDGADGAASGDAGPESSADAPFDAPALADGGTDQTTPDTGFSCATLSPAPRLCVDFANGRLRSAGAPTSTDFEDQELVNATAPELDTSVFSSPPASARFAVDPTSTRAFLFRTFPVSTPVRIDYAMSMRIDGPPDGQVDLMEIRFGNIDSAIFLEMDGVAAHLSHAHSDGDGGTQYDPTPLGRDIPRGTWTRIAWVIETGASPTLSISLDGASVVSKKPLATFTTASGVTFIAGYTDSSVTGGLRLWTDDIVASF